MKPLSKFKPVSFAEVTIEDSFWSPRINTNRNVTIPIEYDQCKKTGRIDAFNPNWTGAKKNDRHFFWDSDVAKWIEAACYTLATHPDKKIEKLVDSVIGLIMNAQQDDGYLNMYFTNVEPENRWKNLRDWHELYCAGHLMEAAVAHYEATGTRDFLDVMCRYADHIDKTFGTGKGKKRGYPGHQEIELALMKLYRVTGEERYKKLASFFIDERGKQPHYYDREAKKRGEILKDWVHKTYKYSQAHLPVREQKQAVGHAVRALYMYCGMVDVANATGDASLVKACKTLWSNLCEKRMFITGGVGGSASNEGFTFDYDLPEETAYSETCAAVANVFFNHRMLHLTGDSQYADVMERALYNGVLSGGSLDGKLFFYSNPLAAHDPTASTERTVSGATWDGITKHRKEWFGCACCPPNLARLIASLGEYIYSQSPRAAWVHLFVAGAVELNIDGNRIGITQKTTYPWNGKVTLTVYPEKPQTFTLNLRIPGWCNDATLAVQGETVDLKKSVKIQKGYAAIKRKWQSGDTVELDMDMPVERIYGHPEIRQTAGRVALQRGPVVYCLETIDNVTNVLDRIALARDAELKTVFKKDLLGGVAVIKGKGCITVVDEGELYRSDPPKTKTVSFTAVPYCVWDNRTPGSMRVWLRSV